MDGAAHVTCDQELSHARRKRPSGLLIIPRRRAAISGYRPGLWLGKLYVPDQPGAQLPGASIPVWSDIGSDGG